MATSATFTLPVRSWKGKIRLNFTLPWHSQSDTSDTFITKEAFNSSFYLHLHTLILINPPDKHSCSNDLVKLILQLSQATDISARWRIMSCHVVPVSDLVPYDVSDISAA